MKKLFKMQKIEKTETSKIKGGAPHPTRSRSNPNFKDVWEDHNDNGIFDPEDGDELVIIQA